MKDDHSFKRTGATSPFKMIHKKLVVQKTVPETTAKVTKLRKARPRWQTYTVIIQQRMPESIIC